MIPKRLEGMNLIPFIDIMLVLLVIVLTSASFISQGKIPVNLPQNATQSRLEAPLEQEFTITATGDYFYGKERILPENLPALIASIPKDTPLAIRGDAKSQLERFVKLLGALQEAGLQNLSLITQENP